MSSTLPHPQLKICPANLLYREIMELDWDWLEEMSQKLPNLLYREIMELDWDWLEEMVAALSWEKPLWLDSRLYMTLHLWEETWRVASTSSTRGRLVAAHAGMLWKRHCRMRREPVGNQGLLADRLRGPLGVVDVEDHVALAHVKVPRDDGGGVDDLDQQLEEEEEEEQGGDMEEEEEEKEDEEEEKEEEDE
ncbi:hypothetical protein CRUP_010330 [Coryphaenoides rupestris]|nr:hypothetical protein CRUP_010330 [Coryphaenoides rupestris]